MIEKRGNRYRVLVQGSADKLTGKRPSRSGTVGTMAEARRLDAKLKIELEEKPAPAKGALCDYLNSWVAGRKMQVATRTYAREVQVVATILRAAPSLKIQDLSYDVLTALYAKLLAEGRKDGKGGLHPQTVHHCHAVLHKALNDGVRRGQLSHNPASVVDAPRVPHNPKRLPTDAELSVALKALRGNRIWIAVHIMLVTGARRGEALAATWNCLHGNRLNITRSLIRHGGETIVKDVKRPASRRTVVLPQATVEALHEWRVEQSKEMLKRGYRNEGGFILTDLKGRPMNPDAFTSAMRTISTAAGACLSPHALRHLHATQLLRSGIHPKIASSRLGHSAIATTLDIYSPAVSEMQDEAASSAGAHAAKLLGG